MAGTCSAHNAAFVCTCRQEAMRSGEMIYRQSTRRWLFPMDLPWLPFKRVPPFAWTFCPFCGADLPDTEIPKPAEFTNPEE